MSKFVLFCLFVSHPVVPWLFTSLPWWLFLPGLTILAKEPGAKSYIQQFLKLSKKHVIRTIWETVLCLWILLPTVKPNSLIKHFPTLTESSLGCQGSRGGLGGLPGCVPPPWASLTLNQVRGSVPYACCVSSSTHWWDALQQELRAHGLAGR